jgi:ACR3 family arsenite efflux pump ArsB
MTIAVFCIGTPASFATVIGPLVNVALWLKAK